MDLISFFFLIVFFIFISWYLTGPIFEINLKNSDNYENRNFELFQRKEILYNQLKELELDRKIDNISENDFIIERQNLKKEVSVILDELENK